MSPIRPRRYGPLARYYDVLSGERVLYGPGRLAAIEALRLRPGDRVLDVGAGTGLNFARLIDAVGTAGQIVAVDASDRMLAAARRRITANQWHQTRLVTGDAGHIGSVVDGPFDAAVFAYSLSIIDSWRACWEQVLAMVRPGGRIAVADSAYPTGPWSALAPGTWLLFAVGGVHPGRRVWQPVAADTADHTHRTFKGGHVHVAAGTVTGPPRPGRAGPERNVE